MPSFRAVISAGFAAGLVWGTVLILSVSILPMDHIRYLANEQETARLAKYDEDYARLPPNAPLWDLAPFLDTRNETKVRAVRDRIRSLDQRQSRQRSCWIGATFRLAISDNSISIPRRGHLRQSTQFAAPAR